MKTADKDEPGQEDAVELREEASGGCESDSLANCKRSGKGLGKGHGTGGWPKGVKRPPRAPAIKPEDWRKYRRGMVTRALARLRTLETMALASSRARDGLETLKLVEGIIKVWNQIQPLCEQLEEEDRKSKPVGSAQSGSVKL